MTKICFLSSVRSLFAVKVQDIVFRYHGIPNVYSYFAIMNYVMKKMYVLISGLGCICNGCCGLSSEPDDIILWKFCMYCCKCTVFQFAVYSIEHLLRKATTAKSNISLHVIHI